MKRPLSMTSFGRGEFTSPARSWTAEIRSVNHRFLDIKIKIPQKYSPLEENIRKEIAVFYNRGHVGLTISLSDNSSDTMQLVPNLKLAKDVYKCLVTIQEELALQSPPNLSMLSSFRDIITPIEVEESLDAIWPEIRAALHAALQNSTQMRENEGDAIKNDLLGRLESFEHTVKSIEQHVPEIKKKKEDTLKERLDTLLQNIDIDPMRLAQEVAIMTDKLDVTEEIVRLHSHIAQFRQFLENDEPVGRRLDFLLQEFLREINTLASKINDASTAHQSVELKNELEKMREQVQNLE
jgi:uncharacterized protein (TIGR00255 family)